MIAPDSLRAPPGLSDTITVSPPARGLVSFWDFQERSGPFVAKLGRGRYVLEEKSFNPSTHAWSSNNEVRRVLEAPPAKPFGELSASIGTDAGMQMLVVPDTFETAPLLNIHGDNATLTITFGDVTAARLAHSLEPGNGAATFALAATFAFALGPVEVISLLTP